MPLDVSYTFYTLGDRWNTRLRQGYQEDRTAQEARVRADAARQARAAIMACLNQALAAARAEGWELDGRATYPPGVPRTEVEPPAGAADACGDASDGSGLDELYPAPAVYRVTYDRAILPLRRPVRRPVR